MKATQELHELGQSLWLDNITRDLLTKGLLKHYVEELSVTGLTSNPTIFDHAIKNSTAYDAAIRQKLKEGKSGEGLFFELALEDLTQAADLFRPIWDKTNGGTAGCRWKCRRSWPMTRRALWLRPRSCMPEQSDLICDTPR
jgi:transaldolase